MLVLTRHIDEDVMVDHPLGTVRVVIVGVEGDMVRLGFDAPPDVKIYRKEIYDSIQRGETRETYRRGK